MARTKVGVDVDGVLAWFTKGAREELKKMFNGHPADELVQTGWGFDSLGVTDEQVAALWAKIDSIPNWWEDLERMPDTNYLRHLCEYCRVTFITDRKDGLGNPIDIQTQNFLITNFHLFRPNVIISGDKAAAAKALDLDFYLDDRPRNVEAVIAQFPKCKTYILDSTYNQKCPAPRVYSFDEFATLAMPIEVLDKMYYRNGGCI